MRSRYGPGEAKNIEWLGEPSFIAAAIGMFVNTVLLLVYPAYYVFYVFVLPVELILVIILALCGGRARQAGVGLVLSWVGSLASLIVCMSIIF
ncbi:hypothetical protein [Nocardia sp. R6R-6]|uniref:hypothetical protein n=1 Tax=Nocardia sp. R6R-6 TaxID=3459303 RepID=UPI00403DD4F5